MRLELRADGIVGRSEFGTGLEIAPSRTATPITGIVAGTLIETVDGLRPVEQIRPGDRILTHLGESVAVRWVGRRIIDLEHCPNRLQVLPICIKAGALGAGVPLQDLYVSPDHALLFYGRLVAAQKLLNELSINQPSMSGTVVYHLIECHRHVVLSANGVQVESYLDLNGRVADPWRASQAVGPTELAAKLVAPYAGRKLAASVRQNLLARAARARARLRAPVRPRTYAAA